MDESSKQISSVSSGFRCGYVAIIGWPNVGKSTLMNALLGTKLSIVTPKPQTTRESILGILNEEKTQLVFVDTPGWIRSREPFHAMMKKNIMRALHDDADLLLWMVEPKPLGEEELALARTLQKTGKPLFVAVNKIDQAEGPEKIESVKQQLTGILGDALQFFPISAKTKQGLTPMKKALLASLPLSPPYFPPDQLSDRWERFFVAELIREQIFSQYHEEIPHASAVVIEEFREQEGEKDYISAVIFSETEGQKQILIGKKGAAVKELGRTAREKIEAWLGRPVFLALTVKVAKNWRKDPHFLKSLQERDQT